MTTPVLSISTTEKIGRVYQVPGGSFAPKLTGGQATLGLHSGKLFPSITNIVDVVNPRLEGYFSHMARTALEEGKSGKEVYEAHNLYRDATAERGTRVHKFIEDFIDNGCEPGDLKMKRLSSYQACLENHAEWGDLFYIKGFYKFLAEQKPQFIHQEATVYGRTIYGRPYAGTTDFVATIGGRVVIGDWKTTSKLKHSVALQLAAVQNATKMTIDFETLRDMVAADECWGVQLTKTGGYKIGRVTDIDRSFQLFSSAAELWALKAGVEPLLNMEEE